MPAQTATALDELRDMDPDAFEHAVADVWDAMGWDTRVTQTSNDYGVDVIATRTHPVPEKHVIQAKGYGAETTLGGPDVREYAGLQRQIPDADAIVVVTTGRFSTQAREVASDTNVKLVGADEFAELYAEHCWEPPTPDEQDPSPPAPATASVDTTSDTSKEPEDSESGIVWTVIIAAIIAGEALVGVLQYVGDGSVLVGAVRLLVYGVFAYAFLRIFIELVQLTGFSWL